MVQVLDRPSFDMLLREEKTFVVYVSEFADEIYLKLRSAMERKVFVLLCTPRRCPSVLKYVSEKEMPAILIFIRGVFVRKYTLMHVEEKRIEVFLNRFVNLADKVDRLLLDIGLYQRSKRQISLMLRKLYEAEVECGEEI